MLNPDRLKRIDAWMQAYVDARKFAGASTLIHVDGDEVYFSAAGQCDLATGAPFARETVVRIYSMTKPVTSAILMMLVEEGRVHLDAKLSDILPAFAHMAALRPDAADLSQTDPCPSPTLHQLLTHTSGLSYAFNPGLVPEALTEAKIFFASDQGDLGEMCDRLARLPLAFVPSTRWEYSLGIDVIGRVIEVLEDAPLDAVFRRRLLDPLGMTQTGFAVSDAQLDRFAAMYTPLAGNAMDLNAAEMGAETLREVDRPETSIFRNTTLFSGGGGLVGTIGDYMIFANFLLTGRTPDGETLLSPKTLAFMMRNHLPGDIADMGPSSFAEQPMEGMGFGIGGAVVRDPGRARVPGHVGDFSWGGMASTFFWVDPVARMSVVFFTQLSPSSSYPARPQMKALVHGAMT